MKTQRVALCAVALLSISPSSALAQERGMTLMSGASQYDLGGTGTAPFLSARLDVPLARRVILEPAVTYLRYDDSTGDRTHHLVPEAQVQMQMAGRTWRPYLGVGLGFSQAFGRTRTRAEPTVSTAAGLRTVLPKGWGVRAELRVRSLDPWAGTTADWGLGVGRRF